MTYIPPVYPAAIPNQTTDLPDRTDDIDWIEAWIYNYVKKELIAIMTELGTDPAGAYATVKARLEAIEAAGIDESVILNIYLNSFRIAVLGSYSVLNMIKGISDEYEDETGIDTASSTNEEYDSANDLYKNGFGSDLCTGGAAISGGDYSPTYAKEKAFDNDTGTRWGSLNTGSGVNGVDWIGYDLGDGNDAAINKISIDNYSANATCTSVKLQYSDNGSDWTDLQTFAVPADDATNEFTVTNATSSHRYWRILANADLGGGEVWHVDELEMYAVANMTLISENFTADEAPSDARIIIFEEDVSAITLNTDIKAYASRDDGANYTQITLTDEGNYSGSKRILSGSVDISGQPSDTNMVYKIESLNSKLLKLHGAALSWA